MFASISTEWWFVSTTRFFRLCQWQWRVWWKMPMPKNYTTSFHLSISLYANLRCVLLPVCCLLHPNYLNWNEAEENMASPLEVALKSNCRSINLVVIYLFQKQIIPFLQSVFLPVVTKIFQVLNTPVDERDQDAASDKRLLQRSYFSFIATLVNNNVQEVLSNQGKILLHFLFLWKPWINILSSG